MATHRPDGARPPLVWPGLAWPGLALAKPATVNRGQPMDRNQSFDCLGANPLVA